MQKRIRLYLGDVRSFVQVPHTKVASLVYAGQEVGVSVGKCHILNGSHEPLEKGSVVGVLLDHSEHIATAPLQDVRQVLVVAGHQVAMVIGEFPILVGYCGNFHLQSVCVCVCVWLKFTDCTRASTLATRKVHVLVTMVTHGEGEGVPPNEAIATTNTSA